MRLNTLLARLGLLAALSFSGAGAAPSLSYYNARSSFNTANPNLPVEDFEEGRVSGVQGEIFNAPLSSASLNSVFLSGEILPGVTFNNSPGASAGGLFLAKPGYAHLFSKALSVADPSDNLEILFSQRTMAVGLDFFALNSSSSFDLNIYGAAGLLGTASVTARTDGVPFFFGVSSTDPITRLSIDTLGGPLELIDNVAFSSVPEPSCFVLLGLVGVLILVRTRRQALQTGKEISA
ncbi:MAG: protein sorting domain, cyanobacterial subclass [Verrucomicrobiales bacterium]|nr:protein sorting domain, cyanobacterial subclass [Verrucomicrobiales bacterium]